MKTSWPIKDVREDWEVRSFMDAYERLPHGRRFEIYQKREKPDYWLRDVSMLACFGLELTSVYLDDRSVPDQHMPEIKGTVPIPDEPEKLEQYKNRLVQAAATKIEKARNGYDTAYPLILSVYVNEYVSIYLSRQELVELVEKNQAVFDEMAPFREIVFWNLPNHDVLSVVPNSAIAE